VARLELDAGLSSVGAARHWAADELLRGDARLSDHELAVLELLVTETVSNAIRHGRGPVSLELTRDVDTGAVHVAVHDGEPAAPVLRDVGSHATGGRGIALVDRLAQSWGTDLEGAQGKTVWFDLAPLPAAA
jgi:anti-sigma regulatory factor (Ser/Thr protein kinase)